MWLNITLLWILISLYLGNREIWCIRYEIEEGTLVDKSVKDEAEDLYKCVNIYEQPAFTHPLLKNHKIQMTPSAHLKGVSRESSPNYKPIKVAPKRKSCPDGTVPIRKSTRVMNSHSTSPLSIGSPGQHVAIVRNADYINQIFYGSQADIEVLNPKVKDEQGSFALISIWNGQIGDENIIQAGWGVSQQIYGDDKTHFVSFWRAGNSGCFNLLCPGFVQVDRDHPVDAVLENISIPNVTQSLIQVRIYQDNSTKHWWLTIPDKSINIGYWPNSLLPKLADGGHKVSWGGLAKHRVNGDSPPMGLGDFPNVGPYNVSAFFIEMKVMYTFNNITTPILSALEPYADQPACYDVLNYNFLGSDVGYYLKYGGPGGNCGN